MLVLSVLTLLLTTLPRSALSQNRIWRLWPPEADSLHALWVESIDKGDSGEEERLRRRFQEVQEPFEISQSWPWTPKASRQGCSAGVSWDLGSRWGDFTVSSSSHEGSERFLRVWVTGVEGQTLYSWQSLAEEHFLIEDGILYRTSFNDDATGMSVVAVDLVTGNEVWNASLVGIGLAAHSKYINHGAWLCVDGKYLVAVGSEIGGGYVEVLDRTSGKTVAHRFFHPDEIDAMMKGLK